MSNEPSDPETPATPTESSARRTGRASPWSKEDTFKLLEELLEARRNREFLGMDCPVRDSNEGCVVDLFFERKHDDNFRKQSKSYAPDERGKII
ncbi:hypothetical protein E4U61_004336 [Claviceps capensis]|nr:hypothetical protein E4U61_004336 [Claviceps capensis]